MNHIKDISTSPELTEELIIRLTGRYYTHKAIARNLIHKFLSHAANLEVTKRKVLKICDPFAGDGRLIYWFIEEWIERNLPPVTWQISLWDIHENGVTGAKENLDTLINKGISIHYQFLNEDAFRLAVRHQDSYDIVITNPPWELIKPDSRELKNLSKVDRTVYIESLKQYDDFLSSNFPKSQPLKKFAGWGTNLSRVGLELTSLITKPEGWVLIVIPASFFADEQSIQLRKDIFSKSKVFNISYYPAEAKLFGNADVSSSTMIFKKTESSADSFSLSIYNKLLGLEVDEEIDIDHTFLSSNGYSIPISIGPQGLNIIKKINSQFETWNDIEKRGPDGLWAGREIDETGIEEWLSDNGEGPRFIKGKMIGRYEIRNTPYRIVTRADWKIPSSVSFEKIVWRDVSRPNQKRRLIATIVSENVVAGNSLGVCYYKDGNSDALRILLAIMNSFCFEFQLRSYLATGHISLSSMRRVCLPRRSEFVAFSELLELSKNVLERHSDLEHKIEAFVAKRIYNLTFDEFVLILETFKKVTEEERNMIIEEFQKIENTVKPNMPNGTMRIPNHFTSKLSKLDMLIVNSVPPGGNWKNIPHDVPSQRIKQIRESYAEGKGSRSTYYGRLQADKPSYTINTYFNRPGNGCHIHYEQDRVLSQREAARLQSFPDGFTFFGSQNSINNQIGNAVPPLLAYQIAIQITKTIGKKGLFVDLFSGAGGMGLGFKWAGWQPIIANDIDRTFLETYSKNVHSEIVPGSITDPNVFELLLERTADAKKKYPNKLLWILGGPPCQGFSTAGNRRTMEDERNSLFMNYTQFLKAVQPEGFVFENVAGLLSMENGEIFEKVKREFKKVIPHVKGFILNAENFAIPQRRKRVFLIGQKHFKKEIKSPNILTSLECINELFTTHSKCVSVVDALSDLPKISPGENGAYLNYTKEPQTTYQKLMRGHITPKEYLESFQPLSEGKVFRHPRASTIRE